VIGTASVSSGVASLSVALSGGAAAHVIEATYSGTAGFAASDSAGRTITVGPTAPVITLVATPDFVGKKARKATFVVLVQAATTGGPVPTGSVTFEINHRTLRTERLVNGSASVVVSSTKATGKTFLVSYRGDTNYKAATSSSIHIAAKFFKTKPPVI
jgi:Bacterial Ig-like domain (group 3)